MSHEVHTFAKLSRPTDAPWQKVCKMPHKNSFKCLEIVLHDVWQYSDRCDFQDAINFLRNKCIFNFFAYFVF